MQNNLVRPLTIAVTFATVMLAGAAEPAPKSTAPKAAAPKAGAPKDAAPKAAPDEPAKPAVDEVLATVDGDPIKRSEVEAAVSQVLAQRGMPANAIPAGQRDTFLRNMIDDLVVDRLVGKASVGIKITDAEVDAEFATIRKSFPGTDEDLAKQLTQAGMTLQKLKADIRDRSQKRKWVDEQIKGKFKEPSDPDAKEFYEKNPQHFEQPEMVRASHILFRLEEGAAPAKITEAMKKAEAAVVRAKKEDFSKLAGELSEEPGAKERGGDLDFFPRTGAMVEPFAEAAFKLKKDEISGEPVRTQFGYHVIKVTDRKAGSKQPFEEAKPKIVEYLGRETKGVAIREVIETLKKGAKVEIKMATPPPPDQPPKGETPPVVKPARKPVEATTPPVSVPVKPAKPAKPEPKN